MSEAPRDAELGKDELLELVRNADVGAVQRVCSDLWKTGLGLTEEEQNEVYRAIKDALWRFPGRPDIVSCVPFEECSNFTYYLIGRGIVQAW